MVIPWRAVFIGIIGNSSRTCDCQSSDPFSVFCVLPGNLRSFDGPAIDVGISLFCQHCRLGWLFLFTFQSLRWNCLALFQYLRLLLSRCLAGVLLISCLRLFRFWFFWPLVRIFRIAAFRLFAFRIPWFLTFGSGTFWLSIFLFCIFFLCVFLFCIFFLDTF